MIEGEEEGHGVLMRWPAMLRMDPNPLPVVGAICEPEEEVLVQVQDRTWLWTFVNRRERSQTDVMAGK